MRKRGEPMPKSARICTQLAVVALTNALTWWLTRRAYQRELARRERMTARRTRTMLREL